MNLIPGICTQCGATLSVDKEKDAMVCPYCGTPFVVEKAIQHFNTTYQITNHINAQNVYIQNEDSSQNKNIDFIINAGVLKRYTGSDTSIVIPRGVYSIGGFSQTNIQSVQIPEGVCEIVALAFSDTALQSVKLPDSVRTIGFGAFTRCKKLKEIVLSQNLRKIGNGAFADCESLTEITLPSKLTKLESRVFQNCTNLKTLRLSSALLRSDDFSEDAFENCPKLCNIYVDGERIEDTNDSYRSRFPYTEQGRQAIRRKQVEQWRRARLCQHCGGAFTGIFTSKCSKCGKPKDYMDMIYEDS